MPYQPINFQGNELQNTKLFWLYLELSLLSWKHYDRSGYLPVVKYYNHYKASKVLYYILTYNYINTLGVKCYITNAYLFAKQRLGFTIYFRCH